MGLYIVRLQKKLSKKQKNIEPIIFMNTPIDDLQKDVIGITSSVNAIVQAIKDGAKMIGVIAEYGTGKSSLTELLIKKEKLCLHLNNVQY